ncbi:hypothetical protein A3C18_03055 [Candidatus Kaiserbacteria bacterium RIFCSPHIGHO2_02_FULL_54_11b]|uniref:Uncharacterized protein n=2 Tax=Candidatus Kaiseribacteriota TaxID=1752734 RepID=A0A1F6CHK7_9BACT|nr:MAG: hypothetical protein A2704_03180 [Candidatus Kaiserbacteria bacterium RIFCSPHIGHO2_01_FULL_54_36b]OGG64519.1 MAG: hypothetical protein A3C18_03055 [Candidatus Kaiserbacteria bacterium RIFCSPHIGHO2_02_FULL_54_11b]
MGLFMWSGATGITASTTTWASPVPPAATSTVETALSLSVRLTGYNAVPEQTDGDPHITASGAYSNPAVIAARSRDLAETLPFGTVIALENAEKNVNCGFETVDHLIGYRVIADSMHPKKQKRIDVLLDAADTVMIGVNGKPRKATNPAIALGLCNVTMRVVGKVSLKNIPATQKELALMMSHTLAVR